MSITKELTAELVLKFGASAQNTGQTEVQIAILTKRIENLTNHLKINKKDSSSKRGLFKLVSQRKRLLKYLKSQNIESFRNLLKALNIRG